MTEILDFINSSFKYLYMGTRFGPGIRLSTGGTKMKQGSPLCLKIFQSRGEVRWTHSYHYTAHDRCCNKGKKRGPWRTSGIGEGRFRQVFLEEVMFEENLKE